MKIDLKTLLVNFKNSRWFSILIGVLLGAVLMYVAIYASYFLSAKREIEKYVTNLISTVSTPTNFSSPSPVPPTDSQFNPTQITWFPAPKTISADFYNFNPDNYGSDFNVVYQQIASFSDGSILINAIVPPIGPGGTFTERFIKNSQGEVYYLTSHNGGYLSLSDLKPFVKQSDIKIPGIIVPDSITTLKGTFQKTGLFGDSSRVFNDLKSPQFVVDTEFGQLYVTRQLRSDLAAVAERQFWLRFRDNTIVPYNLKFDFMSDNRVPQITWSDGASNFDSFEIGFAGKCGAGNGNIIQKSGIFNELSEAGSVNNMKLYKFNSESPVVKAVYDSLDPTTRPNFADFYSSYHHHFLWQDKLGDWNLFINQRYQIQAECGKPVIYLYPTRDTSVNVQVGATITVSEPLYPWSGWQVLAHPDGQLEYQGLIYPNLFWEGRGAGTYNSHLGEGFVVPQRKLIATLKTHLVKLGLNSKEISDFLEFWQPRLPSSSYVRLTWLNTADMNRLAPLYVNPRPDTVIRVFLDFEGLSEPVSLRPQTLTAPSRRGFTLVEWGGLLVK